ncbi:MAG: ATP-binding cassette domain-containing protein [Conexivisphaerales archaeon]
MLEVKELKVEFEKVKVLDNVNIDVNDEKVVLVGPNGSGKSTLFKAILGLAPIANGSIKVFGNDVKNAKEVIKVSTNLAEVYRLANLNVADIIEIYSELKGEGNARAIQMIKEFELEDTLSKKLYQLSTGQQKMVCNILAVNSKAELLLLDEPFDNVDQSRRRRFIELLKQRDAEVLMSTHEFDLLRQLQDWKLCFMLEGKLWGKFEVSQLERLYVSKGKAEGALAIMETSLGVFSVTLDKGDVQVKNATNLSSLLEAAAE